MVADRALSARDAVDRRREREKKDHGDQALLDRGRANPTTSGSLTRPTPTGTGWARIIGGVEQGVASTPSKSDVGLGSVDNTSDVNKPVSTAQAAADTTVAVAAAADATTKANAAKARATHTGTQTMATISDLPTLAAGVWSPTTTNVTNMDSSTPFEGQYLRVGNTVHCTVRVTVDCTAAAPTLSQFDIDLPVTSNLGAVEDLCGVGCITFSTGHAACRIQGDAANNRAAITFHALSTAASSGTLTFSYQVL